RRRTTSQDRACGCRRCPSRRRGRRPAPRRTRARPAARRATSRRSTQQRWIKHGMTRAWSLPPSYVWRRITDWLRYRIRAPAVLSFLTARALREHDGWRRQFARIHVAWASAEVPARQRGVESDRVQVLRQRDPLVRLVAQGRVAGSVDDDRDSERLLID